MSPADRLPPAAPSMSPPAVAESDPPAVTLPLMSFAARTAALPVVAITAELTDPASATTEASLAPVTVPPGLEAGAVVELVAVVANFTVPPPEPEPLVGGVAG